MRTDPADIRLKKEGRMMSGLLWFDNSSRTLTEKIQGAIDYYKKKYGRVPDLCLVNPIMMPKDTNKFNIGSLTVRPYRPVLPGHIWVGIEDKPEQQERPEPLPLSPEE